MYFFAARSKLLENRAPESEKSDKTNVYEKIQTASCSREGMNWCRGNIDGVASCQVELDLCGTQPQSASTSHGFGLCVARNAGPEKLEGRHFLFCTL
jgi:hypothetical protein